MFDMLKWIVLFGSILISGFWLFQASQISLEWLYRKACPEPKPEPKIERFTVQNSLYLKSGPTVLDIGRGVLFDLRQGVITEPNPMLTEPEQKRRIAGSIKSMPVLNRLLQPQQAALPMPQIKVMGADREDVVDL